MSRSLKPLKVEHFHDQKTRCSADLMLNRDDKVFFAVVEHEKIEAPSINELREKVKKAFSEMAQVQWTRVIELNVSKDKGWNRQSGHIEEHEVELSVSFQRFEVGKTAAGIYLKRPLREDEHEMWLSDLDANPLLHSTSDWDHKAASRIPYTEATWAALEGVKEAIEAAHAKLEPLFDPKDKGQKLLALTGMRLLPASTDVVDTAPAKKARKR